MYTCIHISLSIYIYIYTQLCIVGQETRNPSSLTKSNRKAKQKR